MKENPNVIYTNGTKKGVYTGNSITVISGQKEKYGYTLQEVNDRIRSFRPNTIKNYKPVTPEEIIEQNEQLKKWDGKTWNFGEYSDFGDKETSAENKLFEDFKILVKSAAVLKGYNYPSKVRGGTYQDVDDFFNFVTIKLCERRLKQFDTESTCRILNNWPSYLARVIPQYLIIYNKSKFDFEVEAYWPLVRNDKTGLLEPKDFGITFELPPELVSKNDFLTVFNKCISTIPESFGFEVDILMYILYKTSFSNKRLVSQMAEIVKMQMYEGAEEFK